MQPLIATVLFSLLAALLTWPLLPAARTAVTDRGDPLETVWTLNWIASRLPFDLAGLYNAPIFAGFPLSLAYDDTSLAPGFIAWLLIGLTGEPVLAYNLIMFGCYVANGLTVFLLARYVAGSPAAGIIAGVGLAFSTYAFAHISHLSLLSFFPLPLALLALHRWLDGMSQPSRGGDMRRHSVAGALWPPLIFAAALLLQALSSFYYFAYLGVAAALVFGWWLVFMRPWRDWTRPRWLLFAAQCALVAVVAGGALLVLTAPYREVSGVMGFTRTQQEQELGAARPLDYLSVSPRNRVYGERLPQAWPEPLFLGATLMALAAAGLMAAFHRSRGRAKDPHAGRNPRWLLCYFGLALVAFLLSLGPTLAIGDLLLPLPYRLIDLVAGGALRGPARLATLVLLGLGVVAGWGAARLAARLPGRRYLYVPFVALLVALMCVEQITTPQPHVDVAVDPVPQSYRWLASAPPGVLAEFPFSIGLADPTVTSERMYFQGAHGQALLNGYSSFIPPTYHEVAIALDGGILEKGGELLNFEPADIGILQSFDARYVMFDRTLKFYKSSDWRSIQESIAAYPELQPAASFEDDWLYTIYRLAPLGDDDRLLLSYTAPAQLSPGETISLALGVANSYKYPLLARLRPQLDLQARWLEPGGGVVDTQVLSVPAPLTLAPGQHTFDLSIRTPAQPGTYILDLRPLEPAPRFRIAPPATLLVGSGASP